MNNLTLDVLIGLVLIYLVFSIIVSAVTEYSLNGGLGARQNNLKRALQSAFGAESKDDGTADALTDAFLKNGIILTLYQGKSGPSSIPEPIFAKGLISTLQSEISLAERPASPAEFVSMVAKSLDGNRFETKDKLLQTLGTLVKGKETNWDAFERAIADWFAEVGERSIGWYKRRVERWKLGIALALALLLNIDTVLIFNVLSIDSRSRQELTSIATDTLIAAKALPDDEKTRQTIAAIAHTGSPVQHQFDVDQGLAKALGLLRNRVIDDGEYLKYIKSRCTGTVDPDAFKETEKRILCDADLMKWYSYIGILRTGFSESFQRIECAENVECNSKLQKKPDNVPATQNQGNAKNASNKNSPSQSKDTRCQASEVTGSDQLKSCISLLVETTNNLNLVLGIPAKGGESIRKMMEDVVAALNQARFAAEKRIPVMGRYTERYCARIGTDLLKTSTGKVSPNSELIAGIDKERRECSEVFRRARAGDLGLPLTWDEDLRRLRFHMYVPGAQWETSKISLGDWALLFIQASFGFLLTAIALSLGSEFWFNALGRLMAIRLSGARRALEQEAKPVPPTVGGEASGAGGTPGSGSGPSAGAAYFSSSLTNAEARLTKAQILQVQSAIQMSDPYTGEFDRRTREAIHAWHKQRGGADADLWVLEERHVKELLTGEPVPLSADTAGRINLQPAANVLPITPLTLGSRGEEVRLYKALLSSVNDKAGKPLLASAEVDDNFDEKTLKVTQSFQDERDLTKDGVVGPATWLRLTSDLERLPIGLREHQWMPHAIHEIGTSEIPGKHSSVPRIGEYQKVTNGKSDDDISWCSSFAAWVMQQAGISIDKVNALASSWREWGVEESQYTFGSIIVLKDKGKALEANGRGAHVGFLLQRINERYFVLGGNQGSPGSVKVSTFIESAWDVLAIRKPILDKDNEDKDAPSADQGGSSYPLFNQSPSRPRLMRGIDDRQAVTDLQNRLNTVNAAGLDVDGIFGPNTEKAVRAFQTRMGWTPASGVTDEATWTALDSSTSTSIATDANIGQPALSDFLARNNLSMAHVLAVRELESNGSGLVSINGSPKPKILFEGHHFYRLLKNSGVTEDALGELQKSHPDVVYTKWEKSHYRTLVGEWGRLDEARKLCAQITTSITLPAGCNRPEDIADMAASWGLFQIMGFNWKLCGCTDVADFVINNTTEEGQTILFLKYLSNRNNGGLIEALAAQNWSEFARLYNGPKFRENRYDIKLKEAFDKFA